jgi:hypothetical protein
METAEGMNPLCLDHFYSQESSNSELGSILIKSSDGRVSLLAEPLSWKASNTSSRNTYPI